MNFHLVLHDFGYFIDIIISIFTIILIFLKAKSGVAKIMLLLTWICVIIFVTSHAIGVSVFDPDLSRKILMFNLVDIFLPIFSAHCVFALLNKHIEQRKIIIFSYLVGISLATFFIISPQSFLLISIPKLYFPNYYVAGQYYWVMLLFFFSLTIYFLFWMRKMYKISNGIEKNRIKYFFIAMLFGYGFGSIDFLLIYNIPADPLWGFLFVPLFSIPFTYAVLEYNLMSISVIAKKAFIYSITAASLGIILSILNYVNILIVQSYPEFPNWSISLVVACIVSIGVLLIWRKIRESDILKYEFINVVTHKFRTPLTSIKWSSENLTGEVSESAKENLRHIQSANERLIELTNLLVNLSDADDKSYEYVFEKIDINTVISNCTYDSDEKAKYKKIGLFFTSKSPLFVSIDKKKIKFAIQTLIDNAISYTPQGGNIFIDLSISDKNDIVINIRDTGIGILKDELKYIFNKFYRAENGMKADTEGMGIGLYLSKNIVERHKGKISVNSDGEGKGTKFTITLPQV